MRFLALILLLSSPAAAKPTLGERVGAAEKICFVPLTPEPLVATLSAAGGAGLGLRPVNETVELLGEKEIAGLNETARAGAAKALGRELAPAPAEYLKTKKRFGVELQYWDIGELPCDFYAALELGVPGRKREIEFRLGRIDMEKDAAYIPVMPPSLELVLYEKVKAGKKGKKRAQGAVSLVGSHQAESFGDGRTLAQVIEERVDAYHEGRASEDDLESDYFPWSKKRYAGNLAALKEGFGIHAAKLRERAQSRKSKLVLNFEKVLNKKLKKR